MMENWSDGGTGEWNVGRLGEWSGGELTTDSTDEHGWLSILILIEKMAEEW